eukprot:TRINITY_DN8347_c0_g1_i1.p1 TRINITY_DN8347_c0_g1~~TRINITY_DN8347_c0_g1_i1.p1  ORF type:complete len:268 (+),score=19.69 TRINITY_DN8347_c0_g1_i1:62-805(+)
MHFAVHPTTNEYYVIDSYLHAIFVIGENHRVNKRMYLSGLSPPLLSPSFIVFTRDGDKMVISSSLAPSLWVLSANGEFVRRLMNKKVSQTGNQVSCMAIDEDDNLYVPYQGDIIRKLDLSGNVAWEIKAGEAGSYIPVSCIMVDDHERLLYAKNRSRIINFRSLVDGSFLQRIDCAGFSPMCISRGLSGGYIISNSSAIDSTTSVAMLSKDLKLIRYIQLGSCCTLAFDYKSRLLAFSGHRGTITFL